MTRAQQVVGPEDPPPDPLAHHLAERAAEVSALVGDALDMLGPGDETRPEREQELHTTLAGLGLRVCLETLSPDEAVAALARAVGRCDPARVKE